MKSDYGFDESEKLLNQLEKDVHKEYAQASKEMAEKVDAYFAKFKAEDEMQRAKYEQGAITKKEYTEWRQRKMLTGKRYVAMRDNLAKDLTNTDSIAMRMVGNKMIDTYALNMNYGTYQIEHDLRVDTSFTLYNHDSVERLIKTNPAILPIPKPDKMLDYKWNKQHLQSALVQGILQGESISKIAARFQRVAGMDERAAIRNARTGMTGAQNGGRLDAMERAKERGIDVKKAWMATLDNRTRDSHVELDGQEQEIDDEFTNGLMFPGDPEGEPAEVYNCRCRMVHVYGKHPVDWSDTSLRNTDKLGDMTYEEWKEAHGAKKEKEEPKEINLGISGKNLFDTWERRKDEFDFVIDDVINAQGFDGLPRVVGEDEFDKYVKESGFVAQRTYSAPNQEILDSYREQLYNGKWYVDCSTGGSKYGQGMYCAANYDGKVTDAIKQEMLDYQDQNTLYSGTESVNFVETFTIAKDAKIIDYEDLQELKAQTIAQHQKEKLDSIPWKNRNEDDYMADVAKVRREFSKYYNMDEGSFAALMGYDGIRTNAGTSGADTIIVNRTKVIFKEDKP